MILDLHVHTKKSGDASPVAEDYAKWVVDMRATYHIDGFVVCEHKFFDPLLDAAYRNLGKKYDLKIFQGVESQTDYGHILVYGISPAMAMKMDFSKDRILAQELINTAADLGAAVAA